MARLHWEEKSPNILVSDTVRIPITDVYGRHRTIPTRYRVDGRRVADEGWRVDYLTVMGWEAIDGGNGGTSAAVGKQIAQRYHDAQVEQREMTPRTGRDRSSYLRRRRA
jgi:hypothetical protein